MTFLEFLGSMEKSKKRGFVYHVSMSPARNSWSNTAYELLQNVAGESAEAVQVSHMWQGLLKPLVIPIT